MFTLEQNYPNPFNPQTTITYNIYPAKGAGVEVRLNIYNSLGERVSMLEQGVRSAGMHSVRFDGANLSGGTYYYTLQAGDQRQTKKMILVK